MPDDSGRSTMAKVVAVIGASSNRSKFGNRARARLSAAGLHGRSRSTRTRPEVEGLKAYASVLDVPGPIDMASFYVPPEIGEQVIEEVARKEIRRSLVESRRRKRRPDRPRPSARTSSRSSPAASSPSARIRTTLRAVDSTSNAHHPERPCHATRGAPRRRRTATPEPATPSRRAPRTTPAEPTHAGPSRRAAAAAPQPPRRRRRSRA